MTPYPVEPAEARGPMRIVACAFPSEAEAVRVSRRVLEERFAACAQRLSVRSSYWWRGRIEGSEESLVLFKTLPKHVGSLFRRLRSLHPYEVPEIVEIDVPRVNAGYLAYLFETLGGGPPPFPLDDGSRPVRRSGARRGPAARSPRRTPARPPRPSR